MRNSYVHVWLLSTEWIWKTFCHLFFVYLACPVISKNCVMYFSELCLATVVLACIPLMHIVFIFSLVPWYWHPFWNDRFGIHYVSDWLSQMWQLHTCWKMSIRWQIMPHAQKLSLFWCKNEYSQSCSIVLYCFKCSHLVIAYFCGKYDTQNGVRLDALFTTLFHMSDYIISYDCITYII